MSIFVIGINHKTATIELREKAYFALDKLPLYLQDILNQGVAQEAVLISTCNRSELYCEAEELDAAYEWFCQQIAIPREELKAAIYVHRHEAAIAHMMQVACGLDSMVIGEPQILGQMKEAFSESCTAGAVNAVFHRLFQQIFAVAKDIRTSTAVGACPVSVASAAIHFAKQQMPAFEHVNVVLIGVGDTTALLMRYLKTYLNKPMTIVNRTIEKAEALIQEFGGQACGLDALPQALAQADIVFSATSSATPIVTQMIVSEAMAARHSRPMMLIDVAVPRDVESSVADLPNVSLFCIDDLKAIIEQNRRGREHAADKARELITKKSIEFFAELKSIDKVTHTIRAYRGQIEEICQAELLKAKLRLHQGVDSVQVLEMFANAFTKKLLHSPSVQLRQAGAEGRFELLKFAKQLFAIPDPEVERL